MRIGVVSVKNIFVEESIDALSKYADIEAFILKGKQETFSVPTNVNKHVFDKRSIFELMKYSQFIRDSNRFVDIFIIHYLNPLFLIIIMLNFIKKPMVYFCYGGDLKKHGLQKMLLSLVLPKFSVIFVEQATENEFIQNEFQIEKDRIDDTSIIWNVNKCFHTIPDEEADLIRKKWGITKEYVIFSPRTVDAHYNHHILLEGINHLDERWKKEIQVIITGVGDKEYISQLIEMADKFQIDLVTFNRELSPKEMAEIFNISDVNVNIPIHDLFGRCIIEGSLCGSIPLLNSDVPTYHDYMTDGINCFYVKPDSRDVADKLKMILGVPDSMKEYMYTNSLDIFKRRQDSDQNSILLIQKMESLINEGGDS